MVKHPELISFILRAKTRSKILSLLSKEAMYPGQIAKETKLYKSHVSRAIKELQVKKLIFCKNPQDRAFRFYALTSLGCKVWDEVKGRI